ncbi:hypothetical protein Purlil1_14006 [Purpureocillium lilacinum]|uniref:Uncharacterized protein n=1 Tax=Purpureocillium lilacinum TaxID=33203 RepID=A0ABR0BCL8_PURLI|nr:hypothetical protein Purlil1_14006 [Purpureocillium lilacinum]
MVNHPGVDDENDGHPRRPQRVRTRTGTEFPLECGRTMTLSSKPRSRNPRSRKLAVRSHSSAATLRPNGFLQTRRSALALECGHTPTKRFPANSQECARTLIERVSCKLAGVRSHSRVLSHSSADALRPNGFLQSRSSALALECGRTPTKRFPADSQECARTLIERVSCKLAGVRSHSDQTECARTLTKGFPANLQQGPEPDSCAPVAGTQVGQGTGEYDSEYATMSQVFEPRFLGVVQVPIRDLRFVLGVGERLYKQQQTDRLRKLFKETSINHDSRLNWIDGYIDSTTVESLLSQLRLSQAELSQANAQCIYPCIRDQIVYCTQGRHRIAALDAESCVWTVRLSYINLGNLRESRIIKQRTEQYQHEEQDSDGRIYSKLREHTNSHVRFFDWYARLSREKQRIFRAVKRRYALVESLDQLIDIPGVIDFLHFGSLKDVFHHRVDAELLDGLRSIYTQWSYFTLGDPALRGSVNRDTVTTLDGRAPAASRPDREWIHNAFKNPKVFPGVTGAQRDEIERRIQSNPGGETKSRTRKVVTARGIAGLLGRFAATC